MKFAIFRLSALVDIKPLSAAWWVTELLGVILGFQDHKKDQISTASKLVIGN